MFKIGDKVIRTGPSYNSYGLIQGNTYTVSGFVNGDVRLEEISAAWRPDFFRLAPSIDEAKATLEAAGYTVTEPKPKLTGWVNINKGRADDYNFAYPNGIFSSKSLANQAATSHRIACIQFREGDGL